MRFIAEYRRMNANPQDLPARSPDGLAALDVFYAGFNEINFYVEDAEQENLYEVILRSHFPSVRIDRIFPLGGKEAIRSHAEHPQNNVIPAYRAYILDRDFDHLLQLQCDHPNVFYLDRFCIENYLLEEAALIEIVVESHPKIQRSKIVDQLRIQDVLNQTFASLRPLFICFAFTQRFGLALQNCSSPPEMYCKKARRWELEPSALDAYLNAIASVTPPDTQPLLDPVLDGRIADAAALDDHNLISGKHVAMMMFHYLKHNYSLGSITFNSFVYRLAKNCALLPLEQLCQRISAAKEAFNRSRLPAA